jgi:hypothetical protein
MDVRKTAQKKGTSFSSNQPTHLCSLVEANAADDNP